MPEYTTENEVRFAWNNLREISIYKNSAPRTHLNIIVSPYILKNINDNSFQTNYYRKSLSLGKDKEYTVFMDYKLKKIIIMGVIQDRRRKDYRNPLSFSFEDLKEVIKRIEEDEK